MNSIWLVLGLVGSVTITILTIVLSWFTGTGKEAFTRWKNKKLYRRGNYVNALFSMKTGNIKEAFISKDDKDIVEYRNKKYVTNPSLLFEYKGLPTYMYREGTPDPLNVFEERFASSMSHGELDNVMSSQSNFDFKSWWEKNKLLIVIVCGVLVIIGVVSAFASFSVLQMLRDGTYTAVNSITSLN